MLFLAYVVFVSNFMLFFYTFLTHLLHCSLCCSLRMLLSNSNSVSVALGDTTVVVNANPFRIDLIMDNEPVMSVNAKGLLNFERLREKSQ